jgi:AcrR family transcriptional regulator
MERQHRIATRQALFGAAVELFAEQGFQHTSHADIAAAAGIGRTTFYEYFASAEDLLVEVVQQTLPDLVEEMVEVTPDSLEPDEQLGTLCARMIEFVGTDHLGLILHTEVPRLSDEAQRAIALSHRDLSEAFTGIYRRGVESGLFRGMPEPLAGRLIFQVIMTAGRTVMDADEPKQEVHEIADMAVRFLLQGLKA